MTLDQLSKDERTVLMGLLREIVQADGGYSDEEQAEVAQIEEELGGDDFVAAMAAAKERFTSREQLVAGAKQVTRHAAQRLIFTRLLKMASVDGVDEAEEGPLRWLSRVWPTVLKPSS